MAEDDRGGGVECRPRVDAVGSAPIGGYRRGVGGEWGGDDGGEHDLIEILVDAPWLRIRRAGQAEWENVDTGEPIHDDKAIHRVIAEMIRCLENGGVPQLDSSRALRATEVTFATHESARRRGRVDLPLPAGHCALLAMVASGELKVG